MRGAKTQERHLSVAEAKHNLRRSLEEASPARLVEKYPLRSVAAAALVGACLGFSSRARRSLSLFADLALTSSTGLMLRTADWAWNRVRRTNGADGTQKDIEKSPC